MTNLWIIYDGIGLHWPVLFLPEHVPEMGLHPGLVPGFFIVRPAWAHSCGCKSRRKLITTNEAKRNCMRVTECGKEAWSVNREPMNKNRIEGAAKQGERAMNLEAFVIKAKRRRSGGCAMKECVLTWGYLALCLKGRRRKLEREVSSGRSSGSTRPSRLDGNREGPNERE